MTVLITGGTGVIGSWVTRRLVEVEGIRPIVFDIAPNTTLLKDIEGKFEVLRGDTTDLAHIVRTVKKYGIKHIIYMAALITKAEENPPLALKVNTESLINMLEIARSFDIERVVYTSSSAVYSHVRGEHGHPICKPINEDYEFISPKDDPEAYGSFRTYGITKLTSELYGLNYAKAYGIDFVALRFAGTYGPGKMQFGRHTLEASIFNCIIENAMLGKPTKIRGGNAKGDWVYHKDVAKGIALACFAKKLEHRIFHLGTGRGVTLVDLANTIRKIIPEAVIEIGPGLYPYYRGGWVFDTSRAREELGFTPDYSLEEGVKDYIETMRRLNFSPVYTPL